MTEPKLQGKLAIVTGGAGGLGGAISRAFAEAGATVCIADLDPVAAKAHAERIGGAAFGVELDVGNTRSIASMVETVMRQAGRIDVLVNNAGIFDLEPWFSVKESSFDRIFSVNVKGLLFTTQAVAAEMVKQECGAIVNIASAAGRAGNPMSVVYSASKMAVISLTQSAALAFAAKGVRVNAIAPGGILTPMWDHVQALYGRSGTVAGGDMTAHMIGKVPLGRMSTPADHVGAALFLASDDSAYVTGQTLNVDGGLNLN